MLITTFFADSRILCSFSFFFFFNDTATTEIYTLSLHDALPIYLHVRRLVGGHLLLRRGEGFRQGHPAGDAVRPRRDHGALPADQHRVPARGVAADEDRKSTRLNSSH